MQSEIRGELEPICVAQNEYSVGHGFRFDRRHWSWGAFSSWFRRDTLGHGTYHVIRMLLDENAGGQVLLRPAERDRPPRWKEPTHATTA